MLSQLEFKRRLTDELFYRETMDHEVFDLLLAEPNLPLLKMLFLQGLRLVEHFPFYVASLLHHCPRTPDMSEHHKRLAANSYEEFTGGVSNTAGHIELLHRPIRALGVTLQEMAEAETLPGTQNLINYRWSLVNSSPERYHEAAAAVIVASEGQNIQKKARRLRADVLETTYGLTKEDLTFFAVHYAEDPHHVQEGLDLVADVCTNETMQNEAVQAVRTTCDLYWEMHSDILAGYQLQSV